MKKSILTLIICSCWIWLLSVNYGYNQKNMLSEVDYGNGYTVSYNYDANDNITNQIVTQPNVTPLSPTQFCITSNGDMKTLSWEPVTSNMNGTLIIVPLYVIEASSNPTTGFSLIGTTSQTQYTVSSNHYQQRFYRVRAVVNYQRDDTQPAVQVDVINSATRSNE